MRERERERSTNRGPLPLQSSPTKKKRTKEGKWVAAYDGVSAPVSAAAAVFANGEPQVSCIHRWGGGDEDEDSTCSLADLLFLYCAGVVVVIRKVNRWAELRKVEKMMNSVDSTVCSIRWVFVAAAAGVAAAESENRVAEKEVKGEQREMRTFGNPDFVVVVLILGSSNLRQKVAPL